MYKIISDEKIKLSIIIDGNDGQKQLFDLEKATRKLTEENKGLLLQKKLLEKQGKQESDQYKLITKTIKENTAEINKNKLQMNELQKQIGITGLTMKQLNDRSLVLKMTLRNLVPGSADYKKYEAELKQVTQRINELNGKAKDAKFSLSGLADGFNRYQALAVTIIAGLTGVVLSIQKIIDINGELSDAQADVMKTTGMTKKEVDELTKSFGLLQTRTSRIDLLKIAEQGGRIGIVKEEIGEFVNVMNKASVALGDSFTGGVEEVANKLGKLKFLFEETKDLSVDKAYNAIGSAINDLGANGVASEANIADFATRIGSLTDVLKPTIRETLALGAAFEESGIESEVSARAYNIFMKQASTESAKFAKVMNLTKAQVEELINTNPLQFMMKFSEGLRGMNATETAKTLDFLGINADGANKVIGAMGNNMSRFRELIDLSNNSFVAGTSLINEYNVKNENLAATLEKIKKTVMGWFSSESFTKWLADAANNFARLIGATEDADGSMAKWKNTLAFTAKLIAVVIASMISYSAATRVATLVSNGMTISTGLFNVALKLQTFYLSLQKAALIVYTGVMNFFGVATDKASASLARLNLVSKLSPWGALLAVVTAVTVAYLAFSDSTKKAATSQETFAKQMRELSISTAKATSETKANITSLVNLIKDENVSMSTRKKAYEDLIKISPIFNGYLKDEKFNIEGLVSIYQDYLKALDSVAFARQFNKLNEGNIKKQVEAENRLFNAEKNYQKAKADYDKSIADNANKNSNDIDYSARRDLIGKWKTAEAEVKAAKASLENANQLVVETNDYRVNKIKELEASIAYGEASLTKIADKSSEEFKKATLRLQTDKAALEAILGKTTKGALKKSNYTVPTGQEKTGKKDTTKTDEEMNRERLDSEKKFQDEMLRLKRLAEDEAIALMEEGLEKEMTIENLRYKREIEDLEKQKIRKEEMAKLDEAIAKAKKDGDTKYYDFLLQQKESWGKKNQMLNDKINEIEAGKLGIHKLRIATIEEKAAKERLQKANEKYEHEKLNRETAYLEELATLGNNEIAKAKLKKNYEKEELAAQKAFLEMLLKEQQDILKNLNSGVDVTLLSPEQKSAFEKQVDELRNKIAQLMVQIAQLKGGNSGTDFNILSGQGTDILGFSPEQWSQVFSNLETVQEKIQATQTVIGGLQSIWSMYSGFVEANQQRELQSMERSANTKKRRLKQQLDQGIINQRQYKKGIEKIDEDIEKKRAEIEYKKAKRERIATLFSIIANTGLGIMKAVAASPLTGGMPWTAVIAGMGALQAAQVLATPLPAKGYEEGLYPEYVKREQDGRLFKSSGTAPMNKSGLYTKPTILVGEGPGDMPEMVIDKRAYAQISPATKNALIRELRGIKGFENGYYDKSGMIQVPTGNAPQSNDQMMQMMMALVAENTAAMKELKDKPMIAIVTNKDLKSMGYLKDGIKDYENFRQKMKK